MTNKTRFALVVATLVGYAKPIGTAFRASVKGRWISYLGDVAIQLDDGSFLLGREGDMDSAKQVSASKLAKIWSVTF